MPYICLFKTMADHNQLGKTGEDVACQYLTDKGYVILERNWRSSHNELDIIAEYNHWLVIVEVKTRTGAHWENPEDAINKLKMRRIVRAAHHYICSTNCDKPVRFDVLSLIFESGNWAIEHFEDAFLAIHV